MRFFTAAAFLALFATPVLGCSCAPLRHDAPLPDIVVEATVLTYTLDRRQARALVRVERVLKGTAPRTMTIHTAVSPAACGVAFRPGERKRIGVNISQGRHHADSCTQFRIAPPR